MTVDVASLPSLNGVPVAEERVFWDWAVSVYHDCVADLLTNPLCHGSPQDVRTRIDDLRTIGRVLGLDFNQVTLAAGTVISLIDLQRFLISDEN